MANPWNLLAFCAACLSAQIALADDAIRVENGNFPANGHLDLSGATTLVFPRSAKVTRGDRSDIEIAARKQLEFAGQPPRSILMEHWPNYLGIMYCRDGERLYLFPYGEWDTRPKGKRGRVKKVATADGGGASVNLRLVIPVTLQAIGNAMPPKQGKCSAEYPRSFDDESPSESHWYTHTAPPPNWTRVDLAAGGPGKKKAGGKP